MALAVALAACADKPSEKQCRDLLEHTISLEYAEAQATPTDAQKAKLRAFVEKDFMEQCQNELPRARVVCGLAARTKDEARACDEEKEE